MPLWAAWPVVGLLVVYLALYPGLWAALSSLALNQYQSDKNILWPILFVLPSSWVLLEWIRGHFLSGFPWGSLAYSLTEWETLVQSAEIWSVYGLTFLIVLINVLLFLFLDFFSQRKIVKALFFLLGAALFLGAFHLWGDFRIKEIKSMQAGYKPVQAIAVQGSVPQAVKWEPEYQADTVVKYLSLTCQALSSLKDNEVRLVIWPETAAPFYFQEDGPLTQKILSFVKEQKILLLLGSPAYIRNSNKIFYLNSAYLITPEGKVAERYDKRHLVPFGEYMPWGWVTSWAKRYLPTTGEFRAGSSPKPLCASDVCIGTLICFESIFPSLAAQSILAGSQLLAVITNDAWFGKTPAPYQHESMAIFRAVESRRWLIRAANTGISSIITPWGTRVAKSNLFQAGWIKGEVRLCNDITFYVSYGSGWFLCLCLLPVIIFFMKIGIKKGVTKYE